VVTTFRLDRYATDDARVRGLFIIHMGADAQPAHEGRPTISAVLRTARAPHPEISSGLHGNGFPFTV
jgi:hypothetical protein